MKFGIYFALAVAMITTTAAFDIWRAAELNRDEFVIPDVEIEGRITNGTKAAIGQFPYQVALVCRTATSGHFCGASIISPKFLLTAAHCTVGVESATAYLGATKRTSAEITYIIPQENIHTYPDYDGLLVRNDLALIEIPTTTFTERIQAVKLPAKSDSYSTYAGEEAITAGWGRTSDSSGVSEDLNYAIFNIITNLKCKQFFRFLIRDSNICTATPHGTSACQGDSGGALVLKPSGIQVGIVSFGSSKGCTHEIPAVYTRVSSYLDWILSFLHED